MDNCTSQNKKCYSPNHTTENDKVRTISMYVGSDGAAYAIVPLKHRNFVRYLRLCKAADLDITTTEVEVR
jgi:hypothetical protein